MTYIDCRQSNSSYVRGCRCALCTLAHNEYQKDYYHRRKAKREHQGYIFSCFKCDKRRTCRWFDYWCPACVERAGPKTRVQLGERLRGGARG